jgi:hypothetical protein
MLRTLLACLQAACALMGGLGDEDGLWVTAQKIAVPVRGRSVVFLGWEIGDFEYFFGCL